jgi:integrase
MDTTLAKVIAATKVTGTKTFLVNEQGEPFAKSSFAAFMRRAYANAGLPAHCRNHGLRKCMMLDLVAIEVKAHDIMAMSGHTTLKEIENYTRHFDRRAAAVRAMEKRDRKERQ